MKYLILVLVLFFLTFCNIKNDKKGDNKNDSNAGIIENSNYKTTEEGLTDLKKTIILPYRGMEIEDDKNIIYCSSFEISWNKINDEILNSPILLNRNIAWVDSLNKSKKKQQY